MSSPGTLRFGQVSSKPSAPPLNYDLIYVKTDDVLYIQDSTGTEVALGSSSSITQLTGDVSAIGPGIATATVNSVGGQTASAIAAATIQVSAATSANTPNTLVLRDSSGNFSAGTITASLNGNAATATTTTNAINFTGPLMGDVTGIQTATVVSLVNGFTAAQVGTSVTLTQAATSSNTANTLVLRNASGNFSAGTITASLNGNATTATTATNFSGSLMGDVTGTQGATVVSLVDGFTAVQVGASVTDTQNATSTNTPSTLVERDVSGNFAAGIITASLIGNVTGNVSGSSSSFTGSLSGDVTGTQSVTTIASTVVTGKLLTGYSVGSNTSILATDSILGAFEKTQAQINASTGSAITSLTGDVSATGPGAAAATVNSVGGSSAANIHSAELLANASTALDTNNVIVKRDGTGSFAATNINLTGTISASNFSGSSSGTNTGDVTVTNTNSINLAFVGGQTGLNAALNLSAAGPDAGYIPALSQIESDGLLVEVLAGTPVNIGTTNNIGSAASASRSDHVHAITSPVVLPLLLTGYTTGTNTPISATNSILTAFENLQAQISANVGAAITSLTGDVVATGPGAAASTIQPNVVTNSKLAQMPTDTIKGNNTGGTTNASDLTVSQVNTMLGTVTTIGTYDGNGSVANGLSILGNSIFAQSASVTNPGMVNITTQSFAGNKTFTGTVAISPSSTDALTINSTSFVFDSVNNALGIGIQPATSVMIDGVNTTGASKLVQMTGYGVGSTTGYRGRFARGTIGSPSAVQSGDNLSAISGRGYGTSQFATASTGAINIVAGETFTNTSNLTYLSFATTPTGSVTSAEAMRVASTGVTLGPQSSSTAIHQVNGGINNTVRTVTASTFTVDTTTTDNIIYTDSTSNAITITLPTATAGRVLVIQDKTGQASTNHITVTPPGAVTINGVNASVLLGVNYGGWVFTSDGTNWTFNRLSQLPSVQAISASNIDWSTVGIAGGLFTKTLSANTTFTFSNAIPGQTIVIRLTNTASNFTVTWPTIKWPVQTTPVMTTGAFSDVYTIIYDGTNFFGSYVQNF